MYLTTWRDFLEEYEVIEGWKFDSLKRLDVVKQDGEYVWIRLSIEEISKHVEVIPLNDYEAVIGISEEDEEEEWANIVDFPMFPECFLKLHLKDGVYHPEDGVYFSIED